MKAKQPMIQLYKKRGETPLECIERFKKNNLEYVNEKMTYAGRLDPLAEGLLLVLTGEECKNKEKYLKLDKVYEVDVLFGFATDTYDVLGIVTEQCHSRASGNDTIKELLNSFIGQFSQKYPAYSSKFFNKARSGELKDGDITEKDVEIKSIEIIEKRTISKNGLEEYIKNSVTLVKGDFRQDEILKTWRSVFASEVKQSRLYNLISIKVNCTSGTYMRSLANAIGEKIGISALALNIKRTRVGKYNI